MRARILPSLLHLSVLLLAMLALSACDDGPSGKYKGAAPGGEGTVTLDFQKDNKVKMTGDGPLGGVEFTLDYKVEGDKVTISLPMGGDTLVLVKKGSNYEATEDGRTVVFTRQ